MADEPTDSEMVIDADTPMNDPEPPQSAEEAELERQTDILEEEAASRLGLATSDPRIRTLPGAEADSASFEILGEDHTLGNCLRWIIMKNPDVELCGYSIPHPAEKKLNIRIQMIEGNALDALEKGFQDLEDLCGVVLEKFQEARASFPKPPEKIFESQTL
ncbi:MAG: RNA polymerase subunit AC19 [Vezdaea aestivalis]|nr:MAG: RNA polymerase subunit AC19 [Vezdaea aestivalis]